MEDSELIKIAIFKLRDVENRVRELTNETKSVSIRAKFNALSEDLKRLEQNLKDG